LRPLLGIDFGCRTSVVYAPLDPPGNPRAALSCIWELSRSGRDQTFSPGVAAQVKAGLSIGVNVLAYATNREVRSKEFYFRTPEEKAAATPTERGRLRVANIRHPGGCSAAPRALGNLLDAAGRELDLRVDTRQYTVTLTDEALFNYHLVFMHGRNSFRLTDGERKQLKAYLERGGMVLADSICGSRAFTESFRREMAEILPDHPLQAIPAGDPILKMPGGFDLSTVTRRMPEIRGGTDPLKASLRPGPPVLEAVRLGDRYAVIFSPFDLSCALEKQDSLECPGYIREDAGRIGLNVLLYSLQY
jgi:hypothetical protein